MHSRCNGAHVFVGYEIGGSVTAGEIFAGAFEQVSVAPSTPVVEKGCVASKLPNATFELGLLLGLCL